MMKMLKLLGLTVFVVCIAAFASGCGGGGGGGGGSSMDTETPTAPTEPTTPAEPETPEPTIADIRATVLGILTGASGLANTAGESATAIGGSEDVTDAQLSLAVTWHQNAQNALSQIVAANNLATSATTLEEAQQALSAAQTALTSLQTAQTQLASIQADLAPVVATPPTTPTSPGQQPTDETQFTGGSPLIQHVRNNSIINEAVLSNLATADLGVGTTTANTNASSFPVDTTTAGVTTRGELSVTAQSLSSATRGTTALPSISGIGSGFDMKGEPTTGTTTYVNAYTDISKAKNVRVKTAVDGDSNTVGNQPTYMSTPTPDADYLLLGIWLTVPNADTSGSKMGAFAYGSRDLANITDLPKYDPDDPDITESDLTANADAVSFGITDFVDNNKDLSVTYRGKMTGAYLVGGKAAQLEASVELTAEFRNIGGTTGEGDIGGTINNITAEGQSVDGYIDLVKKTNLSNLTTAISDGVASGVVANQPYTGSWRGQFFEPRYTRTTMQEDGTNSDGEAVKKTLYVYTPQAPGSFAGAFQVRKSGVGDAGIIGAFATRR